MIDVRLRANLKRNTILRFRSVVSRTTTSLDVTADAVVVAGGEGLEVVEGMDRDRVFGGTEAGSESVAADAALGDVVCSLGTNEETVASENRVGGEGGALGNVRTGRRQEKIK